jgi:hypothetical protein
MYLNYKPGDFSDFTDKVSFDVKINLLNCYQRHKAFYDELGKINF